MVLTFKELKVDWMRHIKLDDYNTGGVGRQ